MSAILMWVFMFELVQALMNDIWWGFALAKYSGEITARVQSNTEGYWGAEEGVKAKELTPIHYTAFIWVIASLYKGLHKAVHARTSKKVIWNFIEVHFLMNFAVLGLFGISRHASLHIWPSFLGEMKDRGTGAFLAFVRRTVKTMEIRKRTSQQVQFSQMAFIIEMLAFKILTRVKLNEMKASKAISDTFIFEGCV